MMTACRGPALAVGGAVSVNRHNRKIRKSWWPDEVITKADVIVSHDAPARVNIPKIDRKLGWPAGVLADANEHRRLLLGACKSLRPRQLWLGHYHCRYNDDLYLRHVDGRPD